MDLEFEFDSSGLCDGSDGTSCGNCGRSLLDEGYESYEPTSADDDQDAASLRTLPPNDNSNNTSSRSSPQPSSAISHVTKFLCPRYAKFADAPSQKDSDIFTGTAAQEYEEGHVEIESCGWETQIFVDRKPEVITTDRIIVQDLDDGTLRINDFVIEPGSDLGCGSFCSFKFATCVKDHGFYAVKTVSKKRAAKSGMLFKKSNNPFLNIERETAILKRLNHPNIVKLFEIMDDPEEDMIYFVFEYMDRGCIMTLPTDSPLKEGLAIRYFHDVLCGVEYLHSKSIIHRDLKPENMLLNSFGRVKLIDFGLSVAWENDDDTVRLPYGTPTFTAPECVDEELETGYSGQAMEMWALGVTLFALMFGHVPFTHDNLYELYRIIQEKKVVIPAKPHISLDSRAILDGLLDKDRHKRTSLKRVMASAVFINKNSKHFIPERCKTCQHYSPASCHPLIV
ncbi:Calcium/calmodulin-dependent protein kinase kinase [Hypsibius exemplaris]|uniref:Calcium/calmodulin-dependent protein kinase kinase n=1 Tax=Hypsibius exemplaris TaxID=2072580 RepID=A0A1W0XFW1_HYPEX|nr:Calcium/calmodulin-dependent protein kinase kinase [Hypsibius exemplaris]